MNKQQTLNDFTVKVIGVPLLGILIPNISQLITNSLYSTPRLVVYYLYFTLISFSVWQGNVWMMQLIRKFLIHNKNYHRKITALFLVNVVYSGVVSLLMLRLWQRLSDEPDQSWTPVVNTTLVIITAATFITNIYEIAFLNRESEYHQNRVDQLNVAKAQAELEALKNQIDPHFIFNALNTLSFLITKSPVNAKLYNDTLAKVYRYILSNKDKDLILLKEELEFISNYFYLLKIRFAEAISMVIEISDLTADNFLIPPISLQTLVENAIKHNEFSSKTPLTIEVSVSSNVITVRNIINKKATVVKSSGIGLTNLDNRYKLITQKNITIENNLRYFIVKLPVVKM